MADKAVNNITAYVEYDMANNGAHSACYVSLEIVLRPLEDAKAVRVVCDGS